MREFKFSNRKSDSSIFEETTEQLSLTKAVKNIQNKTETQQKYPRREAHQNNPYEK